MTSIVLQIATASKPDKFLQVRHKPLKYLAADSSQGQRQPAGEMSACPLETPWFRRQSQVTGAVSGSLNSSVASLVSMDPEHS